MRRLIGAVLGAVFFAVPFFAQPAAAAPPMRFAIWHEGPEDSCGDQCRVWVSASGAIKPDTPSVFETFAQQNDIRGLTIVVESEGGSVLGALALGRSIRRLQMTTTVGRTIPLVPDNDNDARAKISPNADCESMCGFVLLAGVKRFVPPEARVRVHQIWLGDRRDDATAASYSAEDLVLVQRDIGRLVQYSYEMGGAGDLLTVALRIPPWEPMRLLSRDELRRMNLDMADNAGDAPVKPIPAGIASNASSARSVTIAEGGWALMQQDGHPILARRHPLTVEGDEIGTFDVSIACGDAADSYKVTYLERRLGFDHGVPDPLKDVAITVRGNATPLKVISSDNKQKREQRNSVASGMMAADLLKVLAEPGARSVFISTTSADSGTMIRLGNTGIAQNLPRLADACDKQARLKSEHAVLVQPGTAQ